MPASSPLSSMVTSSLAGACWRWLWRPQTLPVDPGHELPCKLLEQVRFQEPRLETIQDGLLKFVTSHCDMIAAGRAVAGPGTHEATGTVLGIARSTGSAFHEARKEITRALMFPELRSPSILSRIACHPLLTVLDPRPITPVARCAGPARP